MSKQKAQRARDKQLRDILVALDQEDRAQPDDIMKQIAKIMPFVLLALCFMSWVDNFLELVYVLNSDL